jgi:predicted ferric reductase
MIKRVVQVQRFLRDNAGGDAAIFLAFMGLGITIGFALHDATYQDFHSINGVIMSVGRLSGLIGTYLILIVLILIARVPWIEKSLGFDHLVYLHRTIGPSALILIGIHVLTITIAYAKEDGHNFFFELFTIVTTYSWMIAAAVGFFLLALLGLTSLNAVRKRIKYESWWKVHLVSYFAVFLSFMHQILTGSLFVFNETAKLWWILLYSYTAFTLIAWRFIFPIARSFRHKLKVDHVESENVDTISVYMCGVNLDRIHAHGGNFFEWRFLSRSLWGQAHPYSLSSAPTKDMLRITVKNLGNHSGSLRNVLPGTRVVAEGPYGVFSARRSARDRVVLIGGGVGVTPLRAILEEFSDQVEIDFIYRAVTDTDVILRQELDLIAPSKNVRLHYLVGEPDQHPMGAEDLLALVPHLAECDVYLCGPPGLIRIVRKSCEKAGVPRSRFHHEAFAFGAH